MTTLKECCSLLADGDWIESKDQSNDGIRLIQTGNIGNGEYLEKESRAKYITENTFKNLGCTEVFSGDILVTSLPDPVGRACKIPNKTERMITAVDCSILRVDKTVVDSDYLLLFLQSPQYFYQLTGKLAGTTRIRVSRKNLEKVTLDIPQKGVQAKVVNTLNHIQSIIRIRKQQLADYDTLIKARFAEMFGDPETNPRKWDCIKLGEICDLQNGYAFRSDDYLDHSSVFNCRMSNIRPGGGFDADYHPKFLPEEYWDTYRSYRLVDGDIIIAMTDMASDPKILGVPTIVKSNGHKFLLNQRVGKLMFRDVERMNNTYVMFFLGQEYIRTSLAKSAGGSTQINVGKPAILNINILDPPRLLQDQFSAFVSQVDKSKVVVKAALEKAQLLFDSLMQQYFG